eukprot:TRINITY_DN1165_c0_g1_i1.p1 TRINITY_DN1165_c0_g1~~TRINITY_DN1165_c0_g1_i1.p1  ORF type:complete len:329 (-),score=70.71 TRINITY_DN1165_c0_g1_i1:106-1092(-)
MTVFVSKSARAMSGLTVDDIVANCLAAKCYSPRTLQEVVCTKKCVSSRGGCPICVSGPTNVCDANIDVLPPSDVQFNFEVSAVCTSSRLHMDCPTLLVGVQLAGATHLCVHPVTLRSRAVKRKKKRCGTPPSDGKVSSKIEARRRSSSSSPPQTPPGSSTERERKTSTESDLKERMTSLVTTSLGPTTPFCIVVRIWRCSVRLSVAQVHRSFYHSSSFMLGSGRMLASRATEMTDASVTSQQAMQLANRDNHQNELLPDGGTGQYDDLDAADNRWYDVRMGCYASTEARAAAETFASRVSRDAVPSHMHIIRMDTSALAHVIASFCNW